MCDSARMTVPTTTCKFDVPTGKTVPTDFKLGVGNGAVGGGCTLSGVTAICPGISIGTQPGLQIIYAQIATLKIDTGEKVFLVVSDIAVGDFSYSPDKGTPAPLFRSSDAVTVSFKNFKSAFDQSPANGQFKCKLEVRALQPKDLTGSWTTLGDNIDYSATTGCSAPFSKTVRANGLNWSVKATVSKIGDTTQVFNLHDTYVYRFQGAGIASGQN